MKLFVKIFFVILVLALFVPADSHARLFTAGDNNNLGTNPEPYTDSNNNDQWDSGEPYFDINKNGQWDADAAPDVRNMTYSATWDAAFPNVVCLYNRIPQLSGNPPELIVNKFFVTDSAKVLFGIDNPSACPLPGRNVFDGYPNAVAGEFLISGVICVVNTIIFDSMFKVYCTIILWFYNILYAMIIIYVMFYGLSIMLGIGNDPIREAPKRIIKIILIFFLAVNAQFGFRIIHNGFLSALSGFTDMLTDVQPYYTENGHPAYQKSFLSGLGASLSLGLIDGPGRLLDNSGNTWKPLKGNPTYYYVDGANGQYQTDTILQKANTVDANKEVDEPINYVPFRAPAQQWAFEKEKDANGNPEYKMYPVFKELAITKDQIDKGKIACMIDVRWDPEFPIPGQPNNKGALVEYPRCSKNLLPSVPEMAPYGAYGIYKLIDGKLQRFAHVSIPTSAAPERLFISSILTPKNKTEKCEAVTLFGLGVGEGKTNQSAALPGVCRRPFQGMLGRIDGIFNAVVGDDSAKSIGALAAAVALWGSGAGVLLSVLLMTGVVTLFAAFFQLVWTYVTAVMAVTFLTMLSPIFVSCALFKITDQFFKGWLSALISYTMQPFLIMAFLFVISNMTSLNKLEEMAKKEIGNKQRIVELGSTGSMLSSVSPSFLGPLYEKPKDFDEYYFYNDGSIYLDRTLIDATQRRKYIENKGQKIFDCWLVARAKSENPSLYSGVKSCADVYKLKEQNALGGWTQATKYKKIWEGTYTDNTGKKNGFKGIRGMVAYWESTINPGPEDTIAKEFLDAYSFGKTIASIGVYPLDPDAAINTTDQLAWDDGDSYLGEPRAKNTADDYRGREYPECKERCPAFKPKYDPADKDAANPVINKPTKTMYTDGKTCPKDEPGNVTTCSPNAECLANCMEIDSALDLNYSSLAGAILAWVLLNAVTMAFVGKIPALAEALSKWSPYAPSDMPLGGASRTWDEAGMDGWTQEEKSGFFHGGGLFDTGIVSGRPGGLMTMAGALLGSRDVLQKDGTVSKSRFDPRNPLGGGKNQAAEKNKIERTMAAKREWLGLSREEKANTDKKIDMKEVLSVLNRVKGGADPFVLRPNTSTGLTHKDLYEIIEKVIARSGPGATDDSIRLEVAQAAADKYSRDRICRESELKK